MKKRILLTLTALLLAIVMCFTSCTVDNGADNGDGTSDVGGSGSTGDNTGDGTGDSTGDNTGDGTGDSTGGNTGDGTGDSTGDNTGDGTGDNTGDNTGDSTGDDNTGGAETVLEKPALTKPKLDLSSIPTFDQSAEYVTVNGNVPYFTENQYTTESYEYYSELDSLGRCGMTVACLGKDLMPENNRGSLTVSPTGWHSGGIYERSHLIAFSLAGEGNNEKNLITGTYDLNGVMQTFESQILDYIKETDNHVLYRVEPIFVGDELVARGVQIEAWSVEDNGEGICVNIYVYNAQDDVTIDYATGDFTLPDSAYTYIVNKNGYKIHCSDCTSVHDMKESNKLGFTMTLEELIAYLEGEGITTWSYCGKCKPQNNE